MKLGKRLQQIESMIPAGYNHIWDTCCDHGLLGATLLQKTVAPNVHFVDIVPELIAELEAKLHKFSEKLTPAGSSATWHTHCLDTATLPFSQYPGKHLVIIAGVGGDLTQQIITTILHNHPSQEIDFLLCPVHHEYALRKQLIHLNLRLYNEVLVQENQRIYEVLYVTSSVATSVAKSETKTKPIHPVGDMLWESRSATSSNLCKQYRATRINHYQRAQARNREIDKEALFAYENLIF